MFHATNEEPFFSPCCGVQMIGDIVFGETVCPYCEAAICRVPDDEYDDGDEHAHDCDCVECTVEE